MLCTLLLGKERRGPDVSDPTELGPALDAPVGAGPAGLGLHLVVEELGQLRNVGAVVTQHLQQAPGQEPVHPSGMRIHGLEDNLGVSDGCHQDEHRAQTLRGLLRYFWKLPVNRGCLSPYRGRGVSRGLGVQHVLIAGHRGDGGLGPHQGPGQQLLGAGA